MVKSERGNLLTNQRASTVVVNCPSTVTPTRTFTRTTPTHARGPRRPREHTRRRLPARIRAIHAVTRTFTPRASAACTSTPTATCTPTQPPRTSPAATACFLPERRRTGASAGHKGIRCGTKWARPGAITRTPLALATLVPCRQTPTRP